MKSFTDNQGRVWELTVDPFDVKRIQGRLGYNLLDVRLKDEALAAWFGDPIRIVDTLWLLCESQAVKLGVSDEDFGRSLRGSLFDAAHELLQELTDFFPLPSQRDSLTARLALQLEGMKLEHATQTHITTAMRRAMAGVMPSGIASNSPASLASGRPG